MENVYLAKDKKLDKLNYLKYTKKVIKLTKRKINEKDYGKEN